MQTVTGVTVVSILNDSPAGPPSAARIATTGLYVPEQPYATSSCDWSWRTLTVAVVCQGTAFTASTAFRSGASHGPVGSTGCSIRPVVSVTVMMFGGYPMAAQFPPPGVRSDGSRNAVASASRPLSARCSIRIIHRPSPGTSRISNWQRVASTSTASSGGWIDGSGDVDGVAVGAPRPVKPSESQSIPTELIGPDPAENPTDCEQAPATTNTRPAASTANQFRRSAIPRW